MESIAQKNPAGVRPPSAFAGRMRVAFLVADLVMHAMRRNPEHRSALKRQRGADGHRVFQPLGHLVAAMSEQPVIAHADADVDGQDIKRQHHQPAVAR